MKKSKVLAIRIKDPGGGLRDRIEAVARDLRHETDRLGLDLFENRETKDYDRTARASLDRRENGAFVFNVWRNNSSGLYVRT